MKTLRIGGTEVVVLHLPVIVAFVLFTALPLLGQTPANLPCRAVSWWPLDSTTADVMNLNNATVAGNGGTFVPAKVGNGWKSGGQGSVIVVPDSATVDLMQDFSIDMWVRLDAINQLNMPLIWKGNTGGAGVTTPYAVTVQGLGPGIGSPGALIVTISNGTDNQRVHSASALPLNQFKHIAVTVDMNNIKIYIDGTLDSTNPRTAGIVQFNSAQPLQIGGIYNATAANYFNGVIDEVTIYNRALDPTSRSEIAAIFQAGSAGKCR